MNRSRRSAALRARPHAVYRRALVLVAVVCGVLLSAPAWALRCNGSLVTEGDPAFQVRAACGPPDHVTRLYGHEPQLGIPDEELWYYNFGRQRLVRELHFRNGRLSAIRTTTRGFSDSSRPGDCRPTQITTGMSGYELRTRCGPPDQREGRHLQRPVERNGIIHGYADVWVEDWYYDFGDRYIARRVRLEDGRVQRVETVP